MLHDVVSQMQIGGTAECSNTRQTLDRRSNGTGATACAMLSPEATPRQELQLQQLTIKLRLRDKHATELDRQARAVNFVWNYCNEAQRHMVRWDRWLSKYDLMRLTAGASTDLDVHAHTVQHVCRRYVDSRRQHKLPWLRWRGSKSLGWVPFNTGHVSFDGEAFTFRGVRYEPMHLRDLLKPGIKIGAGSFNADSRGHWYVNVPIKAECATSAPNTRVGIDLGLEDLIAMSNGGKIEAPRFYRKSEDKLATKQRARKAANQVRNIHRKIANRRKDFLHKESTKLVKKYGLIVIGDVSPSKLAKTRMAKSVLDAGWADLKRMLSYKSIRNGGSTIEVSEAWTTQVCSKCRSLPTSRPRGIAGLRIREWTCDDCGTVHDRNVNSARSILRIGLNTLAGGTYV
jgi:putative transposase